MSAALVGTIAVIVLAMGFNYTNGFHDAANAIATSVSTRALTPRIALGVAAVGNLVGSFLGVKVAATVGKGVIAHATLPVVGAGLVGAITWNLVTWYFGIPSSSSQALIGGLVGAALAGGVTVLWAGIWEKIIKPMLVSPLVGFALGFLVMLAVYWIFRRGHPGKLNRGFRIAQTLSAAGMSIGHGMQDAAKTMGIVVLALVAGGYHGEHDKNIPLWVFFLTAAVLAAGTYSGGWRIIKTLGRKVIDLGPAQGFAAETAATTVLFVSAQYGLPISTTHTITSAIMGVGATKRLSAVRWGVAGNIIIAWVLTFPAAAAVAALSYFVYSRFA
ncbi:inorganic phosphate transporter [Longispora fulva]|uniref:PiT family inorganic phosphate transporter n=1 Tax=Longispora fulva TaxID=619741 RepID=A0A8J7GMY2_9ACTN|nr:inorganic phosphate transporter [Longispora fulva]MBG6139868.1 PiT family inorganic phosphate transporter [Longispora fulva]GIG57747.1 inorganic phosphate transporter [Longispora fulva]